MLVSFFIVDNVQRKLEPASFSVWIVWQLRFGGQSRETRLLNMTMILVIIISTAQNTLVELTAKLIHDISKIFMFVHMSLRVQALIHMLMCFYFPKLGK